jgi:SAM-dependent methyltransferase
MDGSGEHGRDTGFAGGIPALYEEYLVPLIFEAYAEDIAERVVRLRPRRVLEMAAGTGVVTRRLAAALPEEVDIVATDLNQAMLDQAAATGTSRPVEWLAADATHLPFSDEAFDVVVCQFGVMFFPNKAAAHAEVRRVLEPGGTYLFNVWDRIETNEFADVVTTAVGSLFPEDPPRFLARTPHGYHQEDRITGDLVAGGLSQPQVEVVPARSRAPSPEIPAIAYCQGTPLRNEIEERDATRLQEATDQAAEALAREFGRGEVDGRIQALVASGVK